MQNMLFGISDVVAEVKILVNPLVVWLWIGGIIMGLGNFIVILNDRRTKRQEVKVA